MIQSRSCEKTLMAPSTVYVNSPNSSSIFFKKNTLPNWQKIMWTPKTKNRSEWRFWKKKMDHLRVHPGCLWWIFGEFSKAPMFSIQIPRRRNRLRTHLSHTPRKTPLKYESLIVAPLNIQIMNEIPLFFSTKKKLSSFALSKVQGGNPRLPPVPSSGSASRRSKGIRSYQHAFVEKKPWTCDVKTAYWWLLNHPFMIYQISARIGYHICHILPYHIISFDLGGTSYHISLVSTVD